MAEATHLYLDVSMIEGLEFKRLTTIEYDEKGQPIGIENLKNKYVISVCNDSTFSNIIGEKDDGTIDKGFVHTWLEIRYYDENGVLQIMYDAEEKKYYDAVMYSFVNADEDWFLNNADFMFESAFDPHTRDRSAGVTERLTFVYGGNPIAIGNLYNNWRSMQEILVNEFPYWSVLNSNHYDSIGMLPLPWTKEKGLNCTAITSLILSRYLGIDFFNGVWQPGIRNLEQPVGIGSSGMAALIEQIAFMQFITGKKDLFNWTATGENHPADGLNPLLPFNGAWADRMENMFAHMMLSNYIQGVRSLDDEGLMDVIANYGAWPILLGQLKQNLEKRIKTEHSDVVLSEDEWIETYFSKNSTWNYYNTFHYNYHDPAKTILARAESLILLWALADAISFQNEIDENSAEWQSYQELIEHITGVSDQPYIFTIPSVNMEMYFKFASVNYFISQVFHEFSNMFHDNNKVEFIRNAILFYGEKMEDARVQGHLSLSMAMLGEQATGVLNLKTELNDTINYKSLVSSVVLSLEAGAASQRFGLLNTTTDNPTVMFDFDGDGVQGLTQWATANEGFLVYDRNGDGVINDGSEMFSEYTQRYDGSGRVVNRIAAVRQEDTNGDGYVNAADANWHNLRIWRDINQDGVTDAGELFTMEEMGIIGIGGTARGNLTYITDKGFTEIKDKYLEQYLPEGEKAQVVAVPDYIKDTYPNILGSGSVRSLWEACVLSSELPHILAKFSAAATHTERTAVMPDFLKGWADTSGMAQSVEERAGTRYNVVHNGLPSADWQQKIQVVQAFGGNHLFLLPEELRTGQQLHANTTVNGYDFIINYDAALIEFIDKRYQAIMADSYCRPIWRTSSI